MVLKGLAETFSSISVSESASDMVNFLAELIKWLGDNSYKRPCRYRNPFHVDWPISTDLFLQLEFISVFIMELII